MTDVSMDSKLGCVFFVMPQWLSGYKYQYIVLFFSWHTIYINL